MASPTPSEAATLADYDLSKTIIPYLDRHLAFPLLAHLVETGVFPVEQVQLAQYELAKGTNMFDYAASLFELSHPGEEPPSEFNEKREKAVSMNERLQLEAQAVLDVIEKPEVAQSLKQDKNQNLQYLKENYNLTLDQISALYNFGNFQFSYGNYSGAADYLYHFRVLSTDPDLLISAHWGKLASDILTGQWETALEELNTLRDTIDSRATASAALSGGEGSLSPALNQLHSRTWHLHWSLFVYFNHPQGRTLLLETFMAPAYLNTIQTSCPWILRYLTTAAILSSSRRNQAVPSRVKSALRELPKIITTEEYQYSDPITRFLKDLYVDFDFDKARDELTVAEKVVQNDFFLQEFKDEFVECARGLISEAYCRIYGRIDIRDLSERLNLSPDEGEKWIVNLIRETRMGADAKIDLEKNQITISRPAQPVYQTVIEKTRGLGLRMQAMGIGLRGIQGGAPAPQQAATAAS
ncbi:eIF3 subunit 6 N terminal domain-containing protein [Schizophyllum commune]|nr:eukaryotic translation initiation factor 3, subunit 6 [Schizophyllum commune Loenen D]KAI5832776.1 eukaryotic translation initiation factor 3, subunit 6 [Schizophyllum commune Tattone D]